MCPVLLRIYFNSSSIMPCKLGVWATVDSSIPQHPITCLCLPTWTTVSRLLSLLPGSTPQALQFGSNPILWLMSNLLRPLHLPICPHPRSCTWDPLPRLHEGSRGRVVCQIIWRSVVWSPPPLFDVLRYPWARYWTPDCPPMLLLVCMHVK